MLVFTLPSFPYVFKVIKDVFGPSKETDRATSKRSTPWSSTSTASAGWPTRSSSPTSPSRETASRPSCSTNSTSSHHRGRGRRPARHPPLLRRATNDPAEHLPRPRDARPARVRACATTATQSATSRSRTSSRATCSAKLRRHPPRPHRLLRLRRDRIPNRHQLPTHPTRPEPRSRARCRTLVRRRPTRRLPRGVRHLPPRRPKTPQRIPRHHAALLEPAFWQECQRRIRAGEIVDFYPYPEALRFRNHPTE